MSKRKLVRVDYNFHYDVNQSQHTCEVFAVVDEPKESYDIIQIALRDDGQVQITHKDNSTVVLYNMPCRLFYDAP